MNILDREGKLFRKEKHTFTRKVEKRCNSPHEVFFWKLQKDHHIKVPCREM